MLNCAIVPHCPASGVNVYTDVPTVAVLIVTGFQVPVMPLVDVNRNAGGVEFWHKGPIAANAGVICVAIVILKVVVVPHCPAPGVKVYTVVPTVVVLIVAGFQVPVIPLVDVKGNEGATKFWHSGPIVANVGVI
jgi:hypothetical protein